MLGFCLTAPLLDVCAKLAAATIPVGQVTGARFLVQSLIMLPALILWRYPLRFDPSLLRLLFARALLLVLSTFCFVAAIASMPIADALAIAFVEPFLLLLIGKYALAEKVGPRRLAACAVGFGGVLLVIQPSFEAFGAVALFPLGTALFFALYMLITRALSRRIQAAPMQFHSAWIGTLICLPILLLAEGSGIESLDPVMPQGIFWFFLIGVGAASSLSHLLMSLALSYAPATVLAPLHYLELVSAAALGYLVFKDTPNEMALAGMVVVIGCGLYIIHRERVQERRTKGA
ncbi:MAG: DMT family transporter [Ectothiorhodospiraceae bacterium AqS1]|nr:DMT family transporter [Ectothiorhodospiraceae bacterium AqS1]